MPCFQTAELFIPVFLWRWILLKCQLNLTNQEMINNHSGRKLKRPKKGLKGGGTQVNTRTTSNNPMLDELCFPMIGRAEELTFNNLHESMFKRDFSLQNGWWIRPIRLELSGLISTLPQAHVYVICICWDQMSQMFLWMGLMETGTWTERTSSWAAELTPTRRSLCFSGDGEYDSVCVSLKFDFKHEENTTKSGFSLWITFGVFLLISFHFYCVYCHFTELRNPYTHTSAHQCTHIKTRSNNNTNVKHQFK